VTEIAREIRLSQSCTTRHLQALQRDGVVARRREGKRVIYRLNVDEPHLRTLFAWVARVDGAMETVDPNDAGVPGSTKTGARPADARQVGRSRPGRRARQEPASSEVVAEPAPSAEEERTAQESPGLDRPGPGDIEDYLL
jgi:hypothetical protein